MASRLFQILRKELISPLTRQNLRFASDSSNLKKTNGMSESYSTALKIAGGFVPGVYVGHILSQRLYSNEKEAEKEAEKEDKTEVKEPPKSPEKKDV